jgi:lipoprotein-anchoring transpeptidase ErfK/SrfK
MRTYNATSPQLIGAAAATLLLFNLPTPATATTEPKAEPSAQPLAAAPAAETARSSEPPAASPEQPSAKPGEASSQAPEASAEPAKPKPLPTTLIARINLTTQTMTVQAGGKTIHSWKVSTGAPGFATPPGNFRPSWMAKDWRSRQYDDAPMPYSVFFNRGIAVHGTMNPGSLGRAASHGCVRLATPNAAKFFKLVQRHGMAQTRIVVHGRQPFANGMMVAGRQGVTRPANRQTHSGTQWYYEPAPRAAPRRQRTADGYAYNPSPRQGLPRTARVRTTYWSQ